MSVHDNQEETEHYEISANYYYENDTYVDCDYISNSLVAWSINIFRSVRLHNIYIIITIVDVFAAIFIFRTTVYALCGREFRLATCASERS